MGPDVWMVEFHGAQVDSSRVDETFLGSITAGWASSHASALKASKHLYKQDFLRWFFSNNSKWIPAPFRCHSDMKMRRAVYKSRFNTVCLFECMRACVGMRLRVYLIHPRSLTAQLWLRAPWHLICSPRRSSSLSISPSISPRVSRS